MHHPQLEELSEQDPRYAYEAYVFLFEALEHTQRRLGHHLPTHELIAEGEEKPSRHVSGKQLCEGACDLALKQFGLMARTVFQLWGINKTSDFGRIVFNLIEAGLMSKTDEDQLTDFEDVCDLDEALSYEFNMDEGE